MAGLWLAANFHADKDESKMTGLGSEASSSADVQLVLRAAVAWRTRATSAAVTNDPRLPNELRTYEATEAIQSSVCWPIGIITSLYVCPPRGPVRPWSSTLIT